MLGWALTFLVVSVIAGILGFYPFPLGDGFMAMGLARFFCYVSGVLAIVLFALHYVRGAPPSRRIANN